MISGALRAVGLQPEEILGRFPHQLSGGQRQRVMVARALLLKPKLIVADEPVSMVDASLRATILGSLRKLTDEHGISILYITHDLATAYQISDSILVLYRAHLAEAGAVEQVVADPQHPYTQLLVSAIPRAQAARDWFEQEEAAGPNGVTPTAAGCCFAERCRSPCPPAWPRRRCFIAPRRAAPSPACNTRIIRRSLAVSLAGCCLEGNAAANLAPFWDGVQMRFQRS